MATSWWAVGLTLVSIAIGAMGPILLKKGAHVSMQPRAIIKNKNLLGGMFLYGLATLVYIPALRGGELSVLYPLVSISYCVVALLSVYLLKEPMNWLKWAGIGCIIASVSLIGMA